MLDRMTPDDIRERSFQLDLGIREDEIEEYLALSNTIIGVIDALDLSAGRTSTVAVDQPDVVRTIEHVTDEERARRDPLNAIVRFTRVKQVGASGALAGKRVVVKDSFAVAGVPMTCGSRLLQGFVPTQDSTVVARLLAAGAEIVGVANMENMAFSGGGEAVSLRAVRRLVVERLGVRAALVLEEVEAVPVGGDQAALLGHRLHRVAQQRQAVADRGVAADRLGRAEQHRRQRA